MHPLRQMSAGLPRLTHFQVISYEDVKTLTDYERIIDFDGLYAGGIVDDDMKMEALKQTNYVKSIGAAQGRMVLERKRVQSYHSRKSERICGTADFSPQSAHSSLTQKPISRK